jgi:hypothetical protein
MAAKKRKFDMGGKAKGRNDNTPKKKAKTGDKKHCNQFNFRKGTSRFGAKCRFSHDKTDGHLPGKDEAQLLHKKAIAAIVAATIRKTAAHIQKKNKTQQEDYHQAKSKVMGMEIVTIMQPC